MISRNPHEAASYVLRVMERSPALIYVFNQDVGQNEYANHNIGTVLGYKSEELVQMGVDLMAEHLHPADRDRVFAHIDALRSLADGEVRRIEYRMRHKDGSWVWLLSEDSVFQRDENGVVTHHIGTAMDITALKCAQEPLSLSA